MDIHCSCPSSLSHAVTLPTPSLISPISGFSFFLFFSCVCVCVCQMSDSLAWLTSPSHSCRSVVHSNTSSVLLYCNFAFLPAGWNYCNMVFQSNYLPFEENPAVVKKKIVICLKTLSFSPWRLLQSIMTASYVYMKCMSTMAVFHVKCSVRIVSNIMVIWLASTYTVDLFFLQI